MAEYHVGCGTFGIYAGIVNKNGNTWKEKSEVTDEALEAVRDYIIHEFLGGRELTMNTRRGYSWETEDGKIIELTVCIKNKKNKKKDSDKDG